MEGLKMPEYKIVEHGIIVDCSSFHFGPFSVVILPETDGEHSFYLRHKKILHSKIYVYFG